MTTVPTCDECHAELQYAEVMDGDGLCDLCHAEMVNPPDPFATVELSPEEMDAHAKETHARVLRGELSAEFVYGEVGYDPFTQEGE